MIFRKIGFSLESFRLPRASFAVAVAVCHILQLYSSVALCKGDDSFRIVFELRDVRLHKTTYRASVSYFESAARRSFYRYRLHHTEADRCSISRIDVHVLRVEALRAVVSVAVANNVEIAMLTSKVFCRARKTHGSGLLDHHCR